MRVVYVKRSVRRRGEKAYEYLSLVEAYRDGARVRHRTLLNLGEVTALKETGQLDRIVAALSAHCSAPAMAGTDLEATSSLPAGAVAAARSYFGRLGLDDHFAGLGERRRISFSLPDAVFAMVANRLIAPASKRALPEWAREDVAMPTGFSHPAAQHYYRALDLVAGAKEATEAHLYSALCNLTNLDLSLICYDLTSTYFEGSKAGSDRFSSRAFGYSRDKRPDCPQVVLGLVTTGDGVPIAHHVFSGDTTDVATLEGVIADTKDRFALGPVCVVADRGLISADNLDAISSAGCDYVIATRLHRDPTAAGAIAASAGPDARWHPVADESSAVCEVEVGGQRYIVAGAFERQVRDTKRMAELVAATEARLLGLEGRVRSGRLKDQRKIAASAERILHGSGVARLFQTEVGPGHFLYHYDEAAMAYDETLAGRYVLATSLAPETASAAQVLSHYRRLLGVEHRFRVLKDFIRLRPVYHFTEARVRGHIAICVLAAVIEALIDKDLKSAGIDDPDICGQALSPKRALRELGRISKVTVRAQGSTAEMITRRSSLQAGTLKALGVDTSGWSTATIR